MSREPDRPKIAVVTGAGTGIGRAASVALAGAGFTVVLAGRRLEPLEAAAASAGNGAVALACDVTDTASVAALFAEVAARFGRLDLQHRQPRNEHRPCPADPHGWRPIR